MYRTVSRRWASGLLLSTAASLSGPAATATAGPAEPTAAVRDADAAVELGRLLFFDPKLSGDRWVSCASCHQPGAAFADGLRRASGVHHRKGVRNTPSLLDVGQQRSMFWDGRRATLEQQALDPLFNAAEHGLNHNGDLLARLRADGRYPPAFAAAYGLAMQEVRVDDVARALASFQRTLVSGTSPFDRYRAGQADALTPAARRGWVVFDQQAGCTGCHVVQGPRPLFTDHRFHALPLPALPFAARLPELRMRVAALHREGRIYDDQVLADPDIAELGRFAFTLDADDVGAFKTPSLRNVALTAPYLHNGSLATLGEVVDHELAHRGPVAGQPLRLTPGQRDDLLAFLQALTGESAAEAGEPDGPPAPQSAAVR